LAPLLRMRKPMDDPSNTTGTLDQADEEALTYTEELEAAAGTEVAFWTIPPYGQCTPPSRGSCN
jgi:hypothetical protein